MSTQSIHNIQITCSSTKPIKIQSRHKPPSSPYLYSPYLSPPWQQSTKKEGDLVLSWRRRSPQAGSGGEPRGGVVDVVVCPVLVNRRRLLLNRSRRSGRSSWSGGNSWLSDDRGVRRRSRRDRSRVCLSGANNGRTEHLRL